MGSIGIMFLDYSTRSKTRSAEPYPVVKVPGPAEARTHDVPAWPNRLPAFRWSVTSGREGTDQGLDEWLVDPRPSVNGGRDRMSGFFSCVGPAEGTSGVGGDEETRTPDPLLAKEMLCQLSYVPHAGG